MGRPPKPASDRQSERVVLHFTPAEKKILKAAAARAQVPLATWVRRRALQNAR